MSRALSLIVVVLTACGGGTDKPEPKPQADEALALALSDYSGERMRGAMGEMALTVHELGELFSLGDPFTDEQLRQARNFVARLETISSSTEPTAPAHQPLVETWEELRGMISTANAEIAADPPQYATARKIPDACVSCHGPQ